MLLAEPREDAEMPTGGDLTTHFPIRDGGLRDAEPVSYGGVTAEGMDQLVNGSNVVHNLRLSQCVIWRKITGRK